MGCPRSATSYSAGAAAGSRSPEEAPVDPSPAPVDRGGPRALARRPDLALAGADGASAPITDEAALDVEPVGCLRWASIGLVDIYH